MIGLSILGVFLLVIVLTIWIFISIIKRIKRKGKNPYLQWGIAIIILFFLITWDWIPSEIYYAYQCKQLPPMQVYKTPEQWIAENQDLIKGRDVEFKIKDRKDLPQVSEEGYQRSTSFVEEFFAYASYSSEKNSILRTYYVKGVIFDRRTGNVLIEQISYLQNVRFDSPPLYTGGKKCSFDEKQGYNYKELRNKYLNIKEK